jgi:hypothetical protein
MPANKALQRTGGKIRTSYKNGGDMQSATETVRVSKKRLWSVRIISALADDLADKQAGGDEQWHNFLNTRA